MRFPRTALIFTLPLAASMLLARSGASLHAQGLLPPMPVSPPPNMALPPNLSAPPTAPASSSHSEYVTYRSGAAQWLSAPRTLALSDGVQFGQDDATLDTEAAIALLDKNQNLLSAKAQGPVHIFDTQDDLHGLHGTVDFTKHLATLTDGITLVVKPGKREANASDGSPRKSFKDPATLTCAKMTYDYRRKIGRIPGPLTVTQVVQTDDGPQTRTLTAEGGLYDGKAQTIQLVGDIKGTYSDGSVIQGDTRTKGKPVVIGTKEGAEYVSVPFQTIGHFTVKQEKDDGRDSSKDSTNDDDDLTLPVPPPHAQTSAHAQSPSPATVPGPAAVPTTPPAAQTPLVQTPAAQASPASPAPAGTP